MFRLNNIRFWADMLEQNPRGVAMISDIMKSTINLEDYSDWDLANRRSLQYQILNGAIILDKEKGLNIKLSPSVLDAYTALYDPAGVATGSLMPYIKNPMELAFMEKEDWMDEEYYQDNRRNKLWGMLPLAGTQVIRAKSAKKHMERSGSMLPGVMPSVFGSTNMPNPERFKNPFPSPYIGGGGGIRFPSPYSLGLYPRTRSYYNGGFSYINTYNRAQYAPNPSAYKKARFSDMRTLNYSPLLARRVSKGFTKNKNNFTANGMKYAKTMMLPSKYNSAKLAAMKRYWS
jgi:hypothetical protein